MSTTPTDFRRGDVILVAFPFAAGGETVRKRRPAVVLQSDRYNRRRSAVVIAAVTSTATGRALPCKVTVAHRGPEGRQAGIRLDSVVDCRTLATVPREEIVSRLGDFPPNVMTKVDAALKDALGLRA
jgi:mRNA interferase MazF